jgi:hypothetical protein
MLAVRLSSRNNKFFIMDESCGPDGKLRGQVPGTPYFNTMKEATIKMFNLPQKNIYTISQKEYNELMKG